MADKCRVCLSGDRRMCAISNTVFQEVWEKLTKAKFNTNDGKPLLVCYICCAQLRKSHELMKRSLKAEELLTAVINKGSHQTQNALLLVASLTQDFDYKYAIKEVHQLECKQFERDTVEKNKKEYEGGHQEDNEEEDNINIKKEEEDWADTHQDDNLDIADVESEIPLDDDKPLKQILEREVRINLESIDIGAPRKRKLKELSQKANPLKPRETAKDAIPLSNAVFKILPNNNYNASKEEDISYSKNLPENSNEVDFHSKQNLKPMVGCYEINKVSTKVDILPKSMIEVMNLIVQNNETFISRVCCDEEVVKEHILKSTNAVASITSVDCIKKTTLNRFLRKQTEEKVYVCDLCDYRSCRRDYLIMHMKYKHVNEMKFSCNMCQYKCVTKGSLNIHFRKHTGAKPYKCDLCDYKCSNHTRLKCHENDRHSNEKIFSCHVCKYKSAQKCNLNRHLRQHTGDKPNMCDFCDYKCSDDSYLNRHIKYKHTKEKNFTCNICQYQCVIKSDLHKHLRKHTGEKPYICEICGYKFTRRSILNKHIASKHAT